MMKDKIYNYLANIKSPVPTTEILQQFFKIYAVSPEQGGKIVSALLKNDDRFIRDKNDNWTLKSYESHALKVLKCSFAEWESIRIGKRKEAPLFLAISQHYEKSSRQRDIYIMDITPEARRLAEKYRDELIEPETELKSFSQHAATIYQTLNQTVLVHLRPYRIQSALDYLIRLSTGKDLKWDAISLSRLARKLYPEIKIRSIEDVAMFLKIDFTEPLNLINRLELSKNIFSLIIEEISETGINTLDQLNKFLEAGEKLIDFDKFNFDEQFIQNLPEHPGVYLMKDKTGDIFYVGKARNLKTRVTSYFVERSQVEEKIRAIHERLYDIEIEGAPNELDALLKEFDYIRRYNPAINTHIRIHGTDVTEFRTRQLILLLPSQIVDEITIYLLNGMTRAGSVTIRPPEINWAHLRSEVDKIFYADHTSDSSLAPERIEIIWRWLSRNRESVNYIEMDKIRDPDDCVRAMKQTLADDELRLQKIFYY